MNSANNITHSSRKYLVVINGSQLPLKLTTQNYSTWRAQITPLLQGHNLMGYDGHQVFNPDYEFWNCQDQLILATIIASLTFAVMNTIADAKTSTKARNKLQVAFANKSVTRILSLWEKLSRTKRDSHSVANYLQSIKSIAEELYLCGSLVSHVDLVVHVLGIIRSEFQDIAAAIHARDTIITFDELQDKLLAHELYLKLVDPSFDLAPMTTNHARKSTSNKYSHQQRQGNFSTATNTFQSSNTHFSHAITNSDSPWLLDYGASHYVTNDLYNLCLHSPYDGNDELQLTDGSSLSISRVGSGTITLPNKSCHLSNVLYVPSAKTKLIYVSQFCDSNQVSIEFFSNYFLMKDQFTGEILSKGQLDQSLYKLTPYNSKSPVCLHTCLSSTSWHQRLGHPNSKIFKFILSKFSLPDSLIKENVCNPYKCNKSHRISFDEGGEYVALKRYFQSCGINHLQTPPHTPQHNGTAECRHRHLVETSLTLLFKLQSILLIVYLHHYSISHLLFTSCLIDLPTISLLESSGASVIPVYVLT
ncbi:hypothetical protein K2173_020272 [Erythroxylum novogranatense]|uniref:Integrase catalytic domain-containing protein n=1 Tax=Erythroxylum novogranatense TaxID=1862640 RepID=A0AAV8UAE4_9ROSI|nr:hypothetical protein K2173_020272 [Erythroxylum novogranatense]